MNRSRRTNDVRGVVLFGKLAGLFWAIVALALPGMFVQGMSTVPALVTPYLASWVALSCTAVPAAVGVVLVQKRGRFRRRRLSAWWIAARSAVLLGVAILATVLTPPVHFLLGRPLDQPGQPEPSRAGITFGVLLVWLVVFRLIDGPRPARARPTPGDAPPRGTTAKMVKPRDIWWIVLPFEEGSYEAGDQREKKRPCVVLDTSEDRAYVLKTTTQSQEGRRNYLPLPAAWMPDNKKIGWLQLHPAIPVSYKKFDAYSGDMKRRLWRQVTDQATAQPNKTGSGWTNKTRPGQANKARPTQERQRTGRT